MMHDIRFALRSLGQSRGFTAAAVLTIGLGMGASAVVFGIVDALVLRPLPFGERSNRLVTLHSTHPTQAQDWDDSDLSYPDMVDIRDAATSLAGVEGLIYRNLSLSNASETERVVGASVTPGLFRLLGVAPQLGRDFTVEDGAEPGAESVAIISDALWHRLFAGSPAVVGSTVPVNGRALTIIGVMPPRFAFPEHQDVWLPYRTSRDTNRDRRNTTTIALMNDRSNIAETSAELTGIAGALAGRYPETNRNWGLHVMPFRDLFVSEGTRHDVAGMLGAVVLVLLVGCANVASLLVARGIGRRREIIVRTALGASRARLLRLLLLDSVVLTVAGGLVALLIAVWSLDALVASMPDPPPYWARIQLDARLLGFLVILSLLTALVCGLAPALRASRVDVAGGRLLGDRSSGATRDQARLQGVLVASQIAISFALLVGATSLARSTIALQTADTGFDPTPLLSLRVYVAGDAYDDPVARARAIELMVDRLRSMPGVDTAAATGSIPADDGGDGIRLAPARPTGLPGEEIGAQIVPISPSFFDTLGLKLLEGRTFTGSEADRVDTDVAIVNRRLAERFWPGGAAVAQPLDVIAGDTRVRLRVVGVAPDVLYEELGEETPQSQLTVYVPHVRLGWRSMALLVRARQDPALLTSAARSAVRSVDPGLAAYDFMTMSRRRVVTSWGERFVGRTFAAFACAAVLLACLGVFGLTSYAAAQRRREIGVRLAVGAQPADVVRLLLRRGAGLALLGGAAGLPLAVAAAMYVEEMLFRVSPWEPAVWVAMPLALAAAVMGACFLPARKASLADPAVALRQE